jgi:hypothetical protein
VVQVQDNTREEIAEAEYGVNLDKHSRETQFETEQTHNEQFVEETGRER